MQTTNAASSSKTIWLSLLVLLACCLFSFWPLAFHIFSLKNDALNYFLPVRHQVSEALNSGYWPFWSPYFNLGYPLHGDMQSGVWNPFVLVFSLFGPYTLRTLQYETLVYIYLSGVGMFFLVEHFCRNWRLSLLIGASFMLCGFNTDSCQFLNWISAASFLPFIFLFYYRTLTEGNKRTALACGIFLYLQLVTAYPADFILTGYLLIALFLWFLFQNRKRDRKFLTSQLLLHAIVVSSFLLLSLPAIISYAGFLPLTERGSGANYEQVMSNSLHPGLLMSYLAPLPTWKASFAASTDPLERNSFFGLIPFCLLILAFFIRSRQPLVRFLKWAFVISLLFSFGEPGLVRVVAYYVLPMMKTFRHPANERLFTLFFACQLAALTFPQIATWDAKGVLRKRVWYFLLVAFGGLLAWALIDWSFTMGRTGSSLKLWIDQMNFSNFLLINVIIQIPFLIALYYWLIKKMEPRFLLVAALLNSCIHAFLFQPLTVVKKDRAALIENYLDSVQVKGYPFPDLHSSLQDQSKDDMTYFREIGTSNLYNKKIGRADYRISPSNLLKQNQFWHDTKIRDALFQYPVFYKADTLIAASDTARSLETAKKFTVVEPGKSLFQTDTSRYDARMVKFSPLNWDMEVQCNQPGFYCLFQNAYPRWQLWVDGKQQEIIPCNIAFMGFQLPAGKHMVSLRYRTGDLAIAFFISCASLLFFVLLLLIPPRRS